jgi:hypothetical protein
MRHNINWQRRMQIHLENLQCRIFSLGQSEELIPRIPKPMAIINVLVLPTNSSGNGI